ncbi:MAG: DUF4810 domain-containing protein [Campylobacter sp.]|nr:DUF4810 domain-containing protein [Campylobacter sp.]
MKFYALLIVALLLGGCGSKKVALLYCHDNSFAESVMNSINEEGDDLASVQKMETALNDMQSKNCMPSPGFYAHLGYLYAKMGDKTKANAYFDKEAELFPESKQFAHFAKSDYKTQMAITNGKFDTNATKAVKKFDTNATLQKINKNLKNPVKKLAKTKAKNPSKKVKKVTK